MAKFLRALGDPARLRLLELLPGAEHAVGECVAHIGLSQNRMSAHLACLAGCGYVQSHRVGRFASCKVADPGWLTWRRSPGRWPPTTPKRWPAASASPPRLPDSLPEIRCQARLAPGGRSWLVH